MKNLNKTGFTLIEILVVIAIISILSMVIFASFEESRKKARDTARSADIQQLAAALKIYGATYGKYPSEADGNCTGSDSFGAGGCLQVLVTSGLYNALPTDPVNEDDSVYQYSNSCASPSGNNANRYKVWTLGERNQSATTAGWSDDNTIGYTTCIDPE